MVDSISYVKEQNKYTNKATNKKSKRLEFVN